ncbi:RNA polymerase sigma factor [Actinophytocola sp. NPDC049390]|uniref:RNA polymerase sigma factor n=1 Tax=Actinophytocola sp. NPDC049390 TaxID=3363894 RepID=UPI003790F61D
MSTPALEDLLRELAPQVLGALVRRFGDFSAAEDAVQEALIDAAVQWPRDGRPDNPRGWLIRVAHRRMTDHLRSEIARRRREDTEGTHIPRDHFLSPAADAPPADVDDTLTLLFLCCHPDLTPSAQIPLTLRAVGGLTTAEIASAFLVPEATMAKRVTRAKQKIKGSRFRLPTAADWPDRLGAVLHVLYLVFNEGYTSTSGESLQRVELAAEAIRLARLLNRMLPDDHEVAGLLALMLLTDARRAARTGPSGELVPMAEQDRTLWDRAEIAEGVTLVSKALTSTDRFGPYQLQAAIAAVHDEAASDEATDWPQILALYHLLAGITDNPVTTLNQAVAELKVNGPAAALATLDRAAADDRLTGHYRIDALRAHILEAAGDQEAARTHYQKAAQSTQSPPERTYLQKKATPNP